MLGLLRPIYRNALNSSSELSGWNLNGFHLPVVKYRMLSPFFFNWNYWVLRTARGVFEKLFPILLALDYNKQSNNTLWLRSFWVSVILIRNVMWFDHTCIKPCNGHTHIDVMRFVIAYRTLTLVWSCSEALVSQISLCPMWGVIPWCEQRWMTWTHSILLRNQRWKGELQRGGMPLHMHGWDGVTQQSKWSSTGDTSERAHY